MMKHVNCGGRHCSHEYWQCTVLFFLLTIVEITTVKAALKNKISFSNHEVEEMQDSYTISDSLEETKEKPSWSKLHSSLFSGNIPEFKQQRLCLIGGYTYREGDIVTTFEELRCGSVEHFPCKCAPDLSPPISCPYCGFYSPNRNTNDSNHRHNAERLQISNADGFFCLKEGEETDPFVGKKGGVIEICSCSLNEEQKAVSTCDPVEYNAEQDAYLRTDRTSHNEIGIGDGKDDNDSSSNANANSNANAIASRTGGNGTNTKGVKNVEGTHTNDNEKDTHNTLVRDIIVANPSALNETEARGDTSASSNNIDIDDKDKDDFCTLVLPDSGGTLTFRRGESYRDFRPNRCNEPSNYPCYCNPDLYNQLECPYCSFYTGDGNLLCAKHGETVSFFVPDSTRGDVETCSCSIPGTPGEIPIKKCVLSNPLLQDDMNDNLVSPDIIQNNNIKKGCPITNPNTGQLVTVPVGESFGDYVTFQGLCGDGNEWPAYCSIDSVDDSEVISDTGQETTKVQRANAFIFDITERDDVFYPHCVYVDTISNTPVCAKNKEQVVYTNEEGNAMQCWCTFDSSGLGGNSSCSPYLEEPSEESDEYVGNTTTGNENDLDENDGYDSKSTSESSLDNDELVNGDESARDDLTTGDKPTMTLTNQPSLRPTPTPVNIPPTPAPANSLSPTTAVSASTISLMAAPVSPTFQSGAVGANGSNNSITFSILVSTTGFMLGTIFLLADI